MDDILQTTSNLAYPKILVATWCDRIWESSECANWYKTVIIPTRCGGNLTNFPRSVSFQGFFFSELSNSGYLCNIMYNFDRCLHSWLRRQLANMNVIESSDLYFCEWSFSNPSPYLRGLFNIDLKLTEQCYFTTGNVKIASHQLSPIPKWASLETEGGWVL